MSETLKWFHATGVCGKATAPIAKMFKDMGWFVTGSDVNFSPPASDILEKAGVYTIEDYHYSHLNKEFWEEKLKQKLDIPIHPDLALVVESVSKNNKELRYARVQNIDMRPFSQILREYLVKENSIVVVGTAGKTTTTGFLIHTLSKAGFNPSYMVGGSIVDYPDSAKNTKSPWSVLEGDEYHNLDFSRGAKFLEYKPKYLIMTNIGWEHYDIFPTQERYIEEFAKIQNVIPEDGLVVARTNDKNVNSALENTKAKIIRFGEKGEGAEFEYDYEIVSDGNTKYSLYENGLERVSGLTTLMGKYNIENFLSSYALLNNLVKKNKLDLSEQELNQLIKESISTFKGIEKRLEILYKSETLVIIDDFGIAPNRAKNSLETIRKYYPDFEITAIFEPNSGSRMKDLEDFNKAYQNSFTETSEVVVPTLSTPGEDYISGEDLSSRLQSLGFNSQIIDTSIISNFLAKKVKTNKKHLFVFFSAYRLTSLAHNFARQYE